MIYADYNGSAPLLPVVREHLKHRLDSHLYANPNAIHSLGQKIHQGIEKCRQTIAEVMGCFPDQIIFGSGSSEGVSAVLHSVLAFAPKEKKVVITSPIEHKVIHNALTFYAQEKGFEIQQVEVSTEGTVELSSLKNLLKTYQGKIALVSIMAVNNETGVVQPYEEMARLCHEHNVEFFCDTTQLIGKGEFHFEKSGVDYAVCSGHKLGALTGTGFVIVKDPSNFRPLIFGASQEKGLRGGTQHYLGIETLAIALKDFHENKYKLEELKRARLDFEKKLIQELPAVILGQKSERLAGTTLLSFPGIHSQAVQIELESHDIFVTTSAACSDNQPETSQVLKVMGVNDQIGRGVIRISLSYSHGQKEYDFLAQKLKETYNKLNKIQSY